MNTYDPEALVHAFLLHRMNPDPDTVTPRNRLAHRLLQLAVVTSQFALDVARAPPPLDLQWVRDRSYELDIAYNEASEAVILAPPPLDGERSPSEDQEDESAYFYVDLGPMAITTETRAVLEATGRSLHDSIAATMKEELEEGLSAQFNALVDRLGDVIEARFLAIAENTIIPKIIDNHAIDVPTLSTILLAQIGRKLSPVSPIPAVETRAPLAMSTAASIKSHPALIVNPPPPFSLDCPTSHAGTSTAGPSSKGKARVQPWKQRADDYATSASGFTHVKPRVEPSRPHAIGKRANGKIKHEDVEAIVISDEEETHGAKRPKTRF